MHQVRSAGASLVRTSLDFRRIGAILASPIAQLSTRMRS
jgi:hypothetical protein